MTAVIFIGSAVISYLLGSIPTGFLWGKACGIDIRQVGSGNIGATNVMRALGKGPGIAVLVLDVAKGFLPVFFAPKLFAFFQLGGDEETVHHFNAILQIVCCLCVIAGHNWTCWLKFRGGKGIATSTGALLAFLPWPLLSALCVWLIVFALSRYVSLASICAAAGLPIATWLIEKNPFLVGFTTLLGLVAIYKHKSNIQRLIAGTENRIGRKGRSTTGSVAPPQARA